MYNRNNYLEKITPFIDKPVIKVITGMRRVGKSYFIQQIIARLTQSGISEQNIVYINKESLDFDFIQNYKDLHNHVKMTSAGQTQKCYLLIDEVQEIDQWEKAIVSFFSQGGIDIYVTGSNATMLSSEIASLLSGRYIEFPIYSLSFKEFLQFRADRADSPEKEFSRYLRYGGFPALHHFDFNDEVVYQYINSLYDTILLKDIIKRNSIRNVSLLEGIARFTFDNVGNLFSAKKVSDYLKSQRLKTGVETVQNYLTYMQSTFSLHKATRYDIKGKRFLELHEKYYLGDIGIRHALLGYREADISGLLENLVFLELKRRGYKVYIGKLNDNEVDFIAEKQNQKLYFQVAYLLSSPETIEREFGVLQKVKDNYPKYVISLDPLFGGDKEGIQHLRLIDFLLSDEGS